MAKEQITYLNLADHLFPPRKLFDYSPFVSQKILRNIKEEAQPLKGRSILRLSATPFGGGVAEMVPYFCALLKDLGINVHWLTIASPWGKKCGYNPPSNFFGFTSGMHYSLQDAAEKWSAYRKKGEKIEQGPVTQKDERLYLVVNNRFAQMILDFQKKWGKADVVINDDPQCAAAITKAKKPNQLWFWRFHPYGDPSSPAWDMLTPYIVNHDAAVLTMLNYFPQGIKERIPVFQNFPFVDPYHKKVQSPTKKNIKAILEEFGIDPQKPILAQISRYDPDKNTLGVIEVYKILKRSCPNLQLVYIGNLAYDNPTSIISFRKMEERIREYNFKPKKDVFLLHTKMNHHRPVGLFYRELAAVWHHPKSYILQLSTREGFGLVVAEAAWCGKPVVGAKVGGIVPQIKDGKTGFLVSPKDYRKAAECILTLIKNPKLSNQMGRSAHKHIRENFLITANLLRWLRLINSFRSF